MRRAAGDQAEDRLREVVLHGPRQLVAHLLLRQLVAHQVLYAVDVLTLDCNVQGMDAVAIRRVHVRVGREQKFDKLNVATGERVVQGCAAASVLPIVGIGAALDEPGGNP